MEMFIGKLPFSVSSGHEMMNYAFVSMKVVYIVYTIQCLCFLF